MIDDQNFALALDPIGLVPYAVALVVIILICEWAFVSIMKRIRSKKDRPR